LEIIPGRAGFLRQEMCSGATRVVMEPAGPGADPLSLKSDMQPVTDSAGSMNQMA
jgi:hypothetical protein